MNESLILDLAITICIYIDSSSTHRRMMMTMMPKSAALAGTSNGRMHTRTMPCLHPYLRSSTVVKASNNIDDVLKENAPGKASGTEGLNLFSRRITQPKSQGASQAMLYGTGLTPDDMNKPQVGISSVWWEGNTCNMHLNDLALEVKLGVEDAGLVGYRFNTIGVSDGISMGTDGMSFSLQSRDLIADSIETVMSAQWYDANISLPGCDKNMPGTIMAMARLNRPSIMIYGGTIRAGTSGSGNKLDIVSAFQSYGGFAAGLIEEEERQDIVKNSCPGPGACGGMYTANTMASAIEALGMSLPYSSSTPAEDPLKKVECRLAGRYLLELMKKDIKPRDIMTKASFENAIVLVMATGGSTNAVLHLIAMARSCGIDLTLDDFQRISDKVPFIADLKPSGKYVMEDLHKVCVGLIDMCVCGHHYSSRCSCGREIPSMA